MANNNILVPLDFEELHKCITSVINNKQKILLKDNLHLKSQELDKEAVVLDLSKLNKVIELDKENFTVTVEGGINFLDFQKQMADNGFFFPIDTYASHKTSLAYNVLHGLPSYSFGKYGTFREYVLGVEAVLFNGDYIKLGGKNIKNVSGIDIIGMLIGSKETLGIITKLTLRLIPLPETKETIVTGFKDLTTASQVATQLTKSSIIPAKLHILSTPRLSTIGDIEWLDTPVLIAEFDGFKASLARKTALFTELIKEFAPNHTLHLTDPEQIKETWNKLREANYQAIVKSPNHISFSSFLSQLPDMLAEMEQIVVEHNLGVQINGSVGRGIIIPLDSNSKADWATKIKDVIFKYQGQVLDTNKFNNTGMDIIQQKLIQAFDPDKISYYGGENIE